MGTAGRERWGGTRLYSSLSRGEKPAESLPNLAGSNVGGYQIVRELGRGGMGVVYLAEHPIIRKRVAVKILRPELARRPDVAQRFVDEARAAALIDHPNSVHIIDLTVLPGDQPCIVMELIEGWRLDELMSQTPLPVGRTLNILTQICEALSAAHARGIVHRDVKPQNVLVVKDAPRKDFVKLLDFGLAKIGDDLEGGQHNGMLVGTPRYMAPEQIRGDACDARTDIYAAGVLAYEMLAADPPFDGGSAEEIAFKQLTEDVRYLESFSAEVNAVLEKALAKAPEDRFSSAVEFCRALSKAVKDPSRLASIPPMVEAVTQRLSIVPEEPPTDVQNAVPHPVTVTPLSGPALKPEEVVASEVTFKQLVADPHYLDRFQPVAEDVTQRETGLRERSLESDAVVPRRSTSQPPSPPQDPFTREFGPNWEQRIGGNHYNFLGIPPDASDEVILAATRRWDVALSNAASTEASSEVERARVKAVRTQLVDARRHLLHPARRALYDAQLRNMRGVALALTSGLPPARFRSLHEEFARRFPDRVDIGRRLSTEAALRKQQGDLAEAIRLLDKALQEDPLSLALHQESFELRRVLMGVTRE